MNSKVTTFYSYKGGSGRSMAMANVAWALATNGERVLAIDWDLEAPGLHRYFHPFLQDPSQGQTAGLVDYIWSYIGQLTSSDDEGQAQQKLTAQHLVQELQLPTTGTGVLHFIGAGVQNDNYSDKVGGLDWGTFYGRFGGESFLDALMQWARANYSHILIDSRTGVADSAGVCTMQLPDTVVMCMVYNRQSIEGTAAVARSIKKGRASRSLSSADIRVVPSRVEDRNNVTAARLHCAKMLRETLRPTNGSLISTLRQSEIKHFPWCSFEEKLAVFEELPEDSGSLLKAMHGLAGQLANRVIAPVEIDESLLTSLWRRAAFEDPRLAELEALASAPDSETVARLVHWIEEAIGKSDDRSDWIGALGIACVKQANALGEIESRAAEFLSEQGFELTCIAYGQDVRGYRSSFAVALQARADFLQRTGRLEEALDLAKRSVKLLESRSASGSWRRAKALERVAELMNAIHGPEAALPVYQEMASLLAKADSRSGYTAVSRDVYRAQRLLAEQYIRLKDHASAFDVLKRALEDARGKRRSSPVGSSSEIANLLSLFAEIGVILYPERAMEFLSDVKLLAHDLLDSPTSAAILERKLVVIESSVHARLNHLDKALEAISQMERSQDVKATMAEPSLDETWEAQASLRLSLHDFEGAQVLLLNIIRHSTRPPSAQLCSMILEIIRHSGNAMPLYDLILKRVSSGSLGPLEQAQLTSVLVDAAGVLKEDQGPVLQFLRELLERSESHSTTARRDS